MNIKRKTRIALTKMLGKRFDTLEVPKNSKVISFDVFDTLVVRHGIAMPVDLLKRINDENFYSLRLDAYKKAKENGMRMGLEDVTIDDIYKFLPLYDPKVEIQEELHVCKNNPEALKLFDKLKKAEYKIIIISDMYLTRDIIAGILTNCGYNIEDVKIYMSSEYGHTKRKGSLFDLVVDQEGVMSNEIFHIGDDLISDYLNARKRGLKAVLVKN